MGAGTPPQVSMSKDESTGQTSWSIDKSELEPFLETDNASDNGTAISQAGTVIDNGTADLSANATDLPTVAVADTEVAEQPEPATPKILPDDSPEQQYRFALNRGLQNDLANAEKAFLKSLLKFILNMNVPLMRCSG